MGEKLVAWRDSRGKVTVMHDLCPHRGVALSVGELHGDCIRCPFHGFEYDASGRCTRDPGQREGCTRCPRRFQVQTYPTHEAHGLIFIYWGQPAGEVPPPRWFDDLDESFSYGSVRDPWDAHYSRVIENQLDVPHVPFIHHNTIGRGGRTVIDGPWVEWQDPDRFFVYTWMRQEDGTPARAQTRWRRPDKPFHLDFIFPNLWQNWISDKVRVVVAFAPVDDEKHGDVPALLPEVHADAGAARPRQPAGDDLQHHRRAPGPPGGGDAAAHAERPADGREADPGDVPIIAYRRRRQELLDAVQGK